MIKCLSLTPEIMIMENFPFTPGEFYEHDDIWPKLKIGNAGGIRPSDENKIVVLFWNAPNEKRDDTSDSMSNSESPTHSHCHSH